MKQKEQYTVAHQSSESHTMVSQGFQQTIEVRNEVNSYSQQAIDTSQLDSHFTLKKEIGQELAITPENNTTAISYQKFKELQGDVKVKSVSKVAKTTAPKDQIVFAKEFTPTRKPEKQQSVLESRTAKTAQMFVSQTKKQTTTERSKQVVQTSNELEDKQRLEKEKAAERLKVEIDAKRKREEQAAFLKAQEEKRIHAEKEKEEIAQKKLMEEQMAKERIEREKQKLLDEEKVRLQTLEREKLALQTKRNEIMMEAQSRSSHQEKKKNLFNNVSRQETPGVGFGSVRTGYVSNKKISLLTRASSAEPPPRQPSESPAPTRKPKSVRY